MGQLQLKTHRVVIHSLLQATSRLELTVTQFTADYPPFLKLKIQSEKSNRKSNRSSALGCPTITAGMGTDDCRVEGEAIKHLAFERTYERVSVNPGDHNFDYLPD